MISITLDTNCIIDLQEDQPKSFRLAMQQIVRFAQERKLDIAVSTRLESEAKHEATVNLYRNLIDKGVVQIIGSTFRLDQSTLGSLDTLVDEELWKSIAQAVFPNRDSELMFRPKGKLPKSSFDIDHLYGHLKAKNDFLVTRDGNILKAKQKLAQMGIQVREPEQVVQELERRPKQ